LRNSVWKPFLVAALVTFATATKVPAQTRSAMDTFVEAAREYAVTHRRVEKVLGPQVVTASPGDLLSHVNALGEAIRRERIHASQGDLFTAPVSNELRVRIANALESRGLSVADLATDEIPEGIDRRSLVVRVGGPFPWPVGSTMLGLILDVLPPLPPELQYRFVFRDLVLVDVHANLVVDVLPNALAAGKF
jgi:hypothetical protein